MTDDSRSQVAEAALQAEEMRRARAERQAPPASTGAVQGRLATVVEIVDTNRLRIDIDGTIVPAAIDRSLGAVRVGDMVDAVHQGGSFHVVKIITWHEPEPVLTKADLPPKPSVTVPAAPTPQTGLSDLSINLMPAYPSGANIADLRYDVEQLWQFTNASVRNNLLEIQQQWKGKLDTAIQNAVSARTAARQTAQELGGTVDYAEAAGTAAEGALESSGNAAVEAGTAVRVQGLSISEMPENLDRAGYEAWNLPTQAQATRILQWRVRTIVDLRAATNRALTYQGQAEIAAFPTPPDVVMDDLDWGTAANNLESVDNWCRDRIAALTPAINRVRTKEALGPGAYTGGTTIWSGASYEAARQQIIVSMRNFRIRMSELGTALKEPVKIINAQQTPNTPAEPQKKIVGIALSGMPDNIDKTEYAADTLTTRAQIGRILAWRIRAVIDLRDATNRARAHFSLPPQGAPSSPPDPLVDDITWSAAVTKITAVDTWTGGVLNALVTNINQVRAQASRGNGSWSGASLTWNGTTYAAARPTLIVSMRNYRIRCQETQTALMDVVDSVNGKT
ncbi:hypothetical protein [Microbacterium sp. No. 7]|uniref:hypothetical protein n=1 Tax=Microbacterium sp. No. 7 TaxID=1714373 RepID=UPI0006D0C7E2|nr:hypothetical protein [Microbacterium sp. No. 7]ALJ20371.1 hypothetical protein AOA12_10800 [Microbacterium sp. No. 7]